MRGFARREVAGKKPVGNDGRTLCGNAFIVVPKRAEAGTVFLAAIGDHVDDIAAVAKLAEFLEGEERRAGKVCFHSENAVELDGMSDGLVNLEAEL